MEINFQFQLPLLILFMASLTKQELFLEFNSNSNKCKSMVKTIDIDNKLANIYSIRFKNFNNFNQLNFDCLDTEKNHVYQIFFCPDRLLIIDTTLKINLIQNYKFENSISLFFMNIKGFDIQSPIIKIFMTTSVLVFFYSELSAYQNGSKIVSCLAKNNYTVFLNSNFIIFSNTVKYNTDTCPLIFNYLNLEQLEFNGITGTFFKNNQLGFVHQNSSPNFKVKILKLRFYKLKLSEKLLNKNLFGMVEYLEIFGRLKSIDKNVFVKLENLRSLNLDLDNFVDILALDKSWFFDLFKNNQSFVLYLPSSIFYNFPNEDFCIFKDFPRNSSINIVLVSENNCSCTKIWVMQRKDLNNCQNFNKIKCNFSEMVKSCNKFQKQKAILYSIDIFYISELIDFITLTLFPVFCILGMASNILIILSFNNQILKAELKKEMFKLILLNSILNFTFCFLYLFHVANVCITYTGIFCSAIQKSMFVQNYEKYVVEFLANVLKTWSNIINVFVSLNRFYFLQNKLTKCSLKRLDQKYTKFMIFFFVIILNCHYIFTIRINNHLNLYNYLDYSGFPIEFTFQNIFIASYPSPVPASDHFFNKNAIFFMWYLVYFIFNDILLFILMAFVDALLLIKFRSSLKSKVKILKCSIEQKSKISKKEDRVTKTICSNCFIFFLLRAMEFSVFLFIFKEKINGINCNTFDKICSNVSQLANLFYLVSCSFQIIIYFSMNSIFRRSLIHIFECILKKI